MLDGVGQRLVDSVEELVWGYGHVFNYIIATVEDGNVTLEGEARWQPDKDSALALVSTQAGVKDVVDRIKILPTSISDDRASRA